MRQSFKKEAERLTVIENNRAKEREAMKQEAHGVFAQARTSNAQYEAEMQRLRDQLTTVVSAGRAIEAQQARQSQEFAEYQKSLLGCEDCKKYESIVEEGMKTLNGKSTIIGHLEAHCNQIQAGLDSSQRGFQYTECAYKELLNKAESCYSDLCNTKTAYDRTEQFMQAQLRGASEQSTLATTEIVQLQSKLRT